MVDADYEGLGGGISQGEGAPRLSAATAERYLRIGGALCSVALVAGFGIWGYKLAVRDVLGVPVIQALDGPMRIAPEGAITVSPRPRSRPLAGEVASAGVPVAPADISGLPEVDPATITVGTRLVQFGTFNTADEARAEWVRLQAGFGELMTEKGLVLQPATSGGRTFFRLRATGFEDEDDARRFCAAFVAQQVTCIPVPQR
jgi:hypothetical protein